MKFLTIVTLILFAKDVVNSYTPDAIADKVGHLPGAESLKFDFNHFSGYLSVQGTGKVGSKTKNLHYWFVESTRDASADPITFWTNGGPGNVEELEYQYRIRVIYYLHSSVTQKLLFTRLFWTDRIFYGTRTF